MLNEGADRMSQGRIIVISGPSAVGKGTVVKRVMELRPDMRLSVSATSRKRAENETEGVDYYYISPEEFQRRIDDGYFLEYAGKFDNRYGTPKQFVLDTIAAGHDVILEIDPQGKNRVTDIYPDAISVFLLPPSNRELIRRIMSRDRDTEEQKLKRITRANNDIAEAPKYDYCFVNDDLDLTVQRMCDVLDGKKTESDIDMLEKIQSEFADAQELEKIIEEYKEAHLS